MTFADKLKELRERATQGEWFRRDDMVISMHENIADGITDYNAELIAFLANHAAEIQALVRAAHSAHQTLIDEGFHAKAIRLGQTLAALEDK